MTKKQDEKRLKELLSVFGKDKYIELVNILKRDQERYHQEQLSLFGVSRSIGSDTKDKFGTVKTSEKTHPNVCELCKYREQHSSSDECDWCLDKNKINQYYG